MTDKRQDTSPAEASQAYANSNGHLTHSEVRDLLFSLLHAERAGARVCISAIWPLSTPFSKPMVEAPRFHL